MVGSCPSLGLIQDSCSEGQAGKHIILGQQSCGNSVCGFHQIHSGFSFTAPRSPPNTAGITPQKYLRYTSACFPVSPPKQPPVKCVIVSFSMKEKLFLSLTGSQLFANHQSNLSEAKGDESPHTTSTAAEAPGRSYTTLHLVTCCLTAGVFPAGVFVVCFCFACAFFVRFWFGFVKTVLLFKSLHSHAWRD